MTRSDTDFSRDRKLPLNTLVGLIINMPKRSLSIEIQEFFDSLGKGLQSSTKGAFSLQRAKLRPLFFQVWNKWLVDNFYGQYGKAVKRWRGFRIQAVDGSTGYLFNNKEVIEYFGTWDNHNSSTPMARIMQIHDILNDITVWGDIRPIKESEKAIIASQVPYLFEDSITLMDRGFPGFGLMYLMINEETPRNFIMRCRLGFNKEVQKFVRSRKSSKTIELAATKESIAMLKDNGYKITPETTIKVRMVKIKLPTGETEILLTSLYSEKLFPISDLKYLYGLRWGIETTYGKQKNQLQMEQFSGHRVLCIQQDYQASLFVSNLQSMVEKQSKNYLHKINIRRKYRYKINRNVSWASLKFNIVRLFLQNNPEKILLQLQKEFERNIEPVRPGRQILRIKRTKRYSGKYQTFTNYKRAI